MNYTVIPKSIVNFQTGNSKPVGYLTVQTTIKEDADRGFIKRNTYYIAPIKTNYFFLDNSFFQKNYPAKIAGFLLLLKAICLNNTDTIQ